MKDLPQHLDSTLGFLYADDTTLLVHGRDPVELQDQLNRELANVARWFDTSFP